MFVFFPEKLKLSYFRTKKITPFFSLLSEIFPLCLISTLFYLYIFSWSQETQKISPFFVKLLAPEISRESKKKASHTANDWKQQKMAVLLITDEYVGSIFLKKKKKIQTTRTVLIW